MEIQIASWIATIISLSGNILVNKQNKLGFIVWIVSNILWITIGALSAEVNYGQLTLFAVYTVLAVQGYKNWTKAENGKK